jgi:hypothetical protein
VSSYFQKRRISILTNNSSSPTTIVPASIGIAILSPERIGEAMFSIPAVMVIKICLISHLVLTLTILGNERTILVFMACNSSIFAERMEVQPQIERDGRNFSGNLVLHCPDVPRDHQIRFQQQLHRNTSSGRSRHGLSAHVWFCGRVQTETQCAQGQEQSRTRHIVQQRYVVNRDTCHLLKVRSTPCVNGD